MKYENIYGENIKELRYFQERFKENLIEKETKENFHEILNCDPLQSLQMNCSYG